MSTTKDILSKVGLFAAGAAIGSAVAWYLTKTKYEQLIQEEINYNKKVEEERYEREPEEEPEDGPKMRVVTRGELDRERLNNIIDEMGYSGESSYDENENEEDFDSMDKPYVISPEEYDEMDYKTVSLTYYEDDILEDEKGKVISKKNIERLVGADFADHFGEYEDDSVFIRNDALKTDYEILRVERSYSGD